MSNEFLASVWKELKEFINASDRIDAAEAYVSIMVENDVSEADIRKTFKSDYHIKEALVLYFGADKETPEDDESYDEDEDEDDDDYVDWN